jgi:RNA polymerase sigma factor (sigma-70 family)
MSRSEMRMSLGKADPVAALDEAELIARAGHDRAAQAELYQRHHRALLDHVYRRTGDVHATEDLVADLFVTVLQALPRYRYRGIPLRYWLLRIATNAVNRWARRERQWRLQVVAVEPAVQVGHNTGSAGGETDPARARRALLSLPPKYQSVLALHYLEGLGLAEVAAILGCRVGTVKSRLARARDALREQLTTRR